MLYLYGDITSPFSAKFLPTYPCLWSIFAEGEKCYKCFVPNTRVHQGQLLTYVECTVYTNEYFRFSGAKTFRLGLSGGIRCSCRWGIKSTGRIATKGPIWVPHWCNSTGYNGVSPVGIVRSALAPECISLCHSYWSHSPLSSRGGEKLGKQLSRNTPFSQAPFLGWPSS